MCVLRGSGPTAPHRERHFYAKGINSVDVEHIVSEARVTRATFYRHFPSKEDLVVDSRVQQTVLDHRAWFQSVMQAELERLRQEPSEARAQFFVMIRDGATAAGRLANREAVCAVFMRGVEAMLTYRPIADPTDEKSPAPSKGK